MYGRTPISTGTGTPVLVTSDGRPLLKTGGITIDWGTVAAVTGTDLTTPIEGLLVKVGNKWLRYGQVMCQETASYAYTLTITGAPTGGSVLLTGYRPDTGFSNTVTLLATSTVAQTQALMDSIYGAGNTVVTGAGAMPTNAQTVTAAGVLANAILGLPTVGTASFIGGTTPALAAAVAAGANAGKFGPYDPAATDGRQTLTPGRAFVLNETILQSGALNTFTTINTDQVGGAIFGGRCFASRIIWTAGTASLANGPTVAGLLAALPQLQPVYQ